MEDIRVMRGTTARQVDVTTPAVTGPHLIVPRNYNRVALILPMTVDGDSAWRLNGDSNNRDLGWPSNDVGAVQAAGLVLDIQRHGALVYGPWWIATGSAGPISVSYFETELVAQ